MSHIDDFWYDDDCPCNGCPSADVCEHEKLACENLLFYASTGVSSRSMAQEPSEGWYLKPHLTFVEEYDYEEYDYEEYEDED